VKCLMYFEPSGISNCDTNNIASSTAFRINTKDINKMKAMRLTSLLFAATQTRLGLADPAVVGPADKLTKWFSIELDADFGERSCLHHTGKKGEVGLEECVEGEKRQLWRSLPNGALQCKQKRGKGENKYDACLVRPKNGSKVELKKCEDEYEKSYVWLYDPFFKKLIHAGLQKFVDGDKTEKKFNGGLTLTNTGLLDTIEYMNDPEKERDNSWNLVNYEKPEP